MTDKVGRETPLDLVRARAAILDHLPADLILKCYQNAGGSEIVSGKFVNPESSATLAANAFGLFLNRPGLLSLPTPALDSGRAQTVCLETQLRFPWSGGEHPWLDVVVTTEDALIAIESKHYEPFRDEKSVEFSDAYQRSVWGPAMGPFEMMRDKLKSGERRFHFLDAAQLVKHAFGLRTQADTRGKAAKLVYLYAEPKVYHNGRPISDHDIVAHREEVNRFAKDVAMSKCEVEFFSLTYSNLLKNWALSGDENVRMHAAAISQRFAI